MANRFQLSQTPGSARWALIDTAFGVMLTFEEHQYNETQEVVIHDEELLARRADTLGISISQLLAQSLREMGDYMYRCHYSTALPVPKFELKEDPTADTLSIIRHTSPRFRIELLDNCEPRELAKALQACAAFVKHLPYRNNGRED
jgi:hypothetical protein